MSENMIEETVQRLFAHEVNRSLREQAEAGEFPGALWQTVVDTGLPKMLCREAHDGIAASWLDALPLLFGIGYYQVPLPLAHSMIGQYFASRAGLNIAADSVMVLACGAQTRQLHLVPEAGDTPASISGVVNAVKWARDADWLLLEVAGESYLLDTRAEGLSIAHAKDIAALPADVITLDKVPVTHRLNASIAGLDDPVYVLYAAAVSTMLAGALEYALDLSVQYAGDRVQFGKPIGKNQALQQQLAVLAGEVACSYTAAATALRDLPDVEATSAPHAVFSAAVAKITTADAVRTGASIAHQVHGAIGFTYEYPLNFATRRLWAWRAEAGGSREWAARLGRAFIAAGADAFWENLTAHTLPQAEGAQHA